MSIFTEPEYRFTTQLPGGQRLVTCQSSNSILITDDDGTISMVIKAGFQMPQGMAVLRKTGEVYVVDRYGGCIKVFEQQFNEDDRNCRFWTIGANMLNQPVGIAIDEDAELLYVADNENHRIAVFRTDGVFVKALGSGYGQEAGQLFCPCGVAVFKGLVFVAEWGNGRLQVFNNNRDGKSMLIVNGIQHAHDVLVSPDGDIFVAQYSHKRVRMLKVTVDDKDMPIFTVKDEFLQLDEPPTSLFWDKNKGLGVVTKTRLWQNVMK